MSNAACHATSIKHTCCHLVNEKKTIMELLYGDVRILQLVQNLGFDKGSHVGPKMAAVVNVLKLSSITLIQKDKFLLTAFTNNVEH